MNIPWWGWLGGAAAGAGGYVVYKKRKAAQAAAAAQQNQNQSQTQAAPITTIPYAVGLNYGNGYSGGSRHGAQDPGSTGTTATVTPTGTTGTSGWKHHAPVVGGTAPAAAAPAAPFGTVPGWPGAVYAWEQ